jgi:hypothetical protein
MILSAPRFILFAGGIVAVIGAAAVYEDGHLMTAVAMVALGVAACVLASLMKVTHGAAPAEPDDIRSLTDARHRELIRGTSMFLRESNFRYSVRTDTRDGAARRSFNAEVNTVRLGFLPAAITDNTNDREGFGYVAFVYDGHRWCGPGLPCPADQTDAVRHAARCVSPLAVEEETRFEGVS